MACISFLSKWLMLYKARYILATKLNSTRSTLSNVDKADRVAFAPYALATKSEGHSGDKNYLLSAKSTELKMFNFGDNVDRDTVDKVKRAGNSRLSTNRQQSWKCQRQSGQSTLLPVLATVDFVASVYRALEHHVNMFFFIWLIHVFINCLIASSATMSWADGYWSCSAIMCEICWKKPYRLVYL